MDNLNNFELLLERRDKLKTTLQAQRKVIDLHFIEVRKEWQPLIQLVAGINRSVSQFQKHPLLSAGLGLMGRTLLASSGITKNWFLRSAINQLISGSPQLKIQSVFTWLGKLFNRRRQ